MTGSLPSAALSPAQLIDRMAATEDLINALQADLARDLAAFAQARDAADQAVGITGRLQGRTTSTEVGLALGVAPLTAAHRIVGAVSAVADHPLLLGLVDSGRVSMPGLQLVIRATEVLDRDQRRVVDAQLAEDAEQVRLTPGMLERAAARRVLAVDPEAAAKRAAKARLDRRVSVINQLDGTGVLWAKLRAEEVVAMRHVLDSRARCLRADGDERSISDLMCDLLVESVTGQQLRPASGDPVQREPVLKERAASAAASPEPAEPEPDPDPWDLHVPDPYPDSWEPLDCVDSSSRDGPSPPRPSSWRLPVKVEVQVVISAATLLGLDDAPALLRGYGAIPAEVAREIADVATSKTLRGLFADPGDGRLLSMESASRCYTGPLRQFALFRDQRCRLTGGRIVDVDHIQEAHRGGATSAANGEGLAKNPHVVKDHPAVNVIAETPLRASDGLEELRCNAPNVAWAMPTGHTYQLPPPPALGEGSRPTSIQAPAAGRTDPLEHFLESLRRRADQRPSHPRGRSRTLRQNQRRSQRQEGRRDRQYSREDGVLRRQRDEAQRRRARRARDLRSQRRSRSAA